MIEIAGDSEANGESKQKQAKQANRQAKVQATTRDTSASKKQEPADRRKGLVKRRPLRVRWWLSMAREALPDPLPCTCVGGNTLALEA